MSTDQSESPASVSHRRDRRGAIGIVALLCFFLAMGIWFITRNSATFDEPIHYYAGHALWHGDFSVSYELPPLSKEIAVLPISLLSRLGLIAAPHFVTVDENPLAGLDLLYRSPTSAGVQLLLGRLPMLLLGLLTTVVIARWAYDLWGMPAAVVATGFAVTEPTFIAHSSLITPDIALTCFYTLFFYLLWRQRAEGSWQTLLLAGVALGAALASKFNALVALPVALAITMMDPPAWPSLGESLPRAWWRRPFAAAVLTALLSLIAGLTLVAVYAVRGIGFWWAGIAQQFTHVTEGHLAFLLGRTSDHGWWYYFPIAFALKTPVLTLAAIVVSLALPHRGMPLRKHDALFLLLPPLAFLGLMMWAGINIGVRYILPVYPFLFIIAARLVTFAPQVRVVPFVLAAAIACNVANTVWLAPYFLASANIIAGGPTGLARALSDSNVDWGQALGELKRYMDREQIPALYLSYFGNARPSDFGIRYQYLPSFSGEESDYLLPPSGKQIVAVSVTNLQGVYLGDYDLYAWLRAKTPVARLGYAIYVYDFTDDPALHCHLAEIYASYRARQHEAVERKKCATSHMNASP